MEYSADIATAQQLAYASQEAPTQADEEYAAQEIHGFLDDLAPDAGTPVLIALLGVPSTELTQSILDEVGSRLVERAPAAVGILLRQAVLGDEPARTNALAVLDQVETRDLARGLVGVLKSDDPDELKEVAARSLLALGPGAGVQVGAAMRDADAAPWITLARRYGLAGTDADALAAQRADRDESAGADVEDVMGVGDESDEAAMTSASGNGRGAPGVGPEDEAVDTGDDTDEGDLEVDEDALETDQEAFAADDGAPATADDALDTAPDEADADAGLGFATAESGDEGYLDAAPDDAGEDEIAQIGQIDDVESVAIDETSDLAADDPSEGDVEDAASQLERDFEAYKHHLDDASGDAAGGGGEA